MSTEWTGTHGARPQVTDPRQSESRRVLRRVYLLCTMISITLELKVHLVSNVPTLQPLDMIRYPIQPAANVRHATVAQRRLRRRMEPARVKSVKSLRQVRG